MSAPKNSGPREPASQTRTPTTLSDVIGAWRKAGPLIHHETPFPTLNRLTGGGPVFGTRWYVMGAPDACKTLFLSLLAQVWDRQNILVGMLAVDEEPEDLAQRFIQRLPMPERYASHEGDPPPFFCRSQCEDRDDRVLDAMLESSSHIGVVFYGAEWTIESAALNLAEMAMAQGKRAALTIDSAQTVECESIRLEKKEISLRERITENTKAIRWVATRYRIMTITTSEMNRAAYRAVLKVEQNDMAAAKESGAIEYSARVMLAMRSVPEEENCIEVKVIKNKHGPSSPGADPFYLALDRTRQTLAEREAPIVDAEPSLVDAVVQELSKHPRGLTSEALAKTLQKRKQGVLAACQSAESAGLIRRESGIKSPWLMCVNVDADSTEFP